MGFLNFIFIIFIIYLIVVAFFRYVLPFLLKRYVRKMQDSFNGNANPKTKSSEKEGIHIEYDSAKKGHKKDDELGEYVDYEDVED
jgi:uncharacterized protein DUF4834